MTKRMSIRGIALAALGVLAAATLGPEGARANFAGDTAKLTVFLDGIVVVDMIEIGPGVEIEAGDGTSLGAHLRPGESVDCDTNGCVFTLQPMQTAFVLSDLDGPVQRQIEEITVGGTLEHSSGVESSTDNQNDTSGTRFTVDCNPFLACDGGTVVVTFVLAPVSGGNPLEAIAELKDAVIEQGFDAETEEKLTRRLDTAINRLINGNTDGAISRMEGFIQKVNRGQVTGAIGAVGDALISVAEEIIGQIQAA